MITASEREQRESRDRVLPERHDDESRQQRSERLAEVSADLEQALGKAVPAARTRPRDARGFGRKDRAADSDDRHREK